MSTQSDYSLTRAAVTLLAALLLTAGTARDAGAAGTQKDSDDVTESGVPAARTPNASQRRQTSRSSPLAWPSTPQLNPLAWPSTPRPSLMSWPLAPVLMPRQ